MNIPQAKSVYSAADFGILGFHDCYIYGIRWKTANYALVLDLDYILQWIVKDGTYNFWVAPAELCFEYASEAQLSLDWTNMAMECQIHDFHRRESRLTPNGHHIFQWEIELARPNGSIILWASGFELRLLSEPRFSKTQRLRGAE